MAREFVFPILNLPEEIDLPCASTCPFGKQCAEKYFDESQSYTGSCAEKINNTIDKELSPYQSEKDPENQHTGRLNFSTARIGGEGLFTMGYVSDGKVVYQETK